MCENAFLEKLLKSSRNPTGLPESGRNRWGSEKYWSASVSASAHPSTVPDTPDEGAEVLYDKDILNNPLWYNAALILGVDPSLTYRKKDTGLQMHYQKYKVYQSA
jgi:hypothetical protein